MAQCISNGFMPPMVPARVPSALRNSGAVAIKGLLDSENTRVAANSATMICATPRAALERSSVTRMRRHATTLAKTEMSQVHSRSDPWRPAHTADTSYRGLSALSVLG